MSYDEAFTRVDRSTWLRTRFGLILDSELPVEVEPFSFVPLAGLREVAAALELRPGETLVDLACGRGGPGMWLARETGAVLTGVDASAVAVAQAEARAGLFELDERVRFTVGDLADTGLPDASADGMICIDSFQFAADPVVCAREVLRVLRARRHFVLTTWEPRQFGDTELPDRFRGLNVTRVLTAAGFTAVDIRERPAWDSGRRAACLRGGVGRRRSRRRRRTGDVSTGSASHAAHLHQSQADPRDRATAMTHRPRSRRSSTSHHVIGITSPDQVRSGPMV
jgi:SAM-dependent methyltransferase